VTSYHEEVAYVRSWYREHWTAVYDAEVGAVPADSEPADPAPDPSQPPSSSDTPPL
jgi:hypothetical protein